jgi:methionyl aminopeptidase
MNPALDCLREAGRIASAVRALAARRVVAGALVRDVCQEADEEIVRRGGGAAFPTQSSRNEIAAHYCPSPTDETCYADGDLAKVDLGVHVDGYVVDTALTVNVGDRPENRKVVDAAREALDAAIAAAGAGVAIRTISTAIETTIRGHGFRPMRNLCGHGVGRWRVHCPPPIPNIMEPNSERLPQGAVIAIEPFATSGGGLVVEQGAPEVFRFDPARPDPEGADAGVMGAVRAFRGLPFARRQLSGLPAEDLETTLALLRSRRALQSYPPLVEASGRPVAQAEHTLYLGEEGVLVLTQ